MRYVGFSRDPERRFGVHVKGALATTGRSHKASWIKSVIAAGARPLWRTLAIVDTAEQAAATEIELIEWYLATGHRLTNGTEGGEGVQGFGGHLSPEAQERRNAYFRTPERRALQTEINARRWSSGETRAQHKQAMKDFWASPEGAAQRERNSEFAKAQLADPAYTGGPRTPAAREKMRLRKLGKPHARPRTPEWNAKISASQKGVKRAPWSEERKAAHRARLNDPATKAKMSNSAKARTDRKKDEP